MALLVTIVTGGLAQVPIFPTRLLVAAIIILSRGLGYIDSSGQSGVLRPRATRSAIATILIVATFLVVLARSFGLGGLVAMRRHGSCILGVEQKEALVLGVTFGRF